MASLPRCLTDISGSMCLFPPRLSPSAMPAVLQNARPVLPLSSSVTPRYRRRNPKSELVSARAEATPITDSELSSAPLGVGSPVVLIAEPPYLKTAEPMPMMKLNEGVLKVGHAGRILDRRPMGVWAVRFAEGAFLIDEKYFKSIDG